MLKVLLYNNSNCRGLISVKDTKGPCSMYCYMQTSSWSEQKRESCYFMFFRINVAIVVRTDFSSVFINQTSLSFEFKRLKLGQLFAISLSRKFRSFGSLLQWNRKWYSSSTSPEEQRSHFLSCRRVPWYLPVSIFNWWQEIRSCVRHLLCSKPFRTDIFFSAKVRFECIIRFKFSICLLKHLVSPQFNKFWL